MLPQPIRGWVVNGNPSGFGENLGYDERERSIYESPQILVSHSVVARHRLRRSSSPPLPFTTRRRMRITTLPQRWLTRRGARGILCSSLAPIGAATAVRWMRRCTNLNSPPSSKRTLSLSRSIWGATDKNLDLAEQYHVPIKHGIPALAVLDSRGNLLYAMDQGQFADARHMSYESIKAFFEQWKPSH